MLMKSVQEVEIKSQFSCKINSKIFNDNNKDIKIYSFQDLLNSCVHLYTEKTV